jgi:hypothetical protein
MHVLCGAERPNTYILLILEVEQIIDGNELLFLRESPNMDKHGVRTTDPVKGRLRRFISDDPAPYADRYPYTRWPEF